MSIADYAPTRPRRASAGTRRHHLKYLTYRIREVVPAAHTVLLLPIEHDAYGADLREYTACVRDRAGVQLKLADGDSRRLAALLQGAFTADWTRAQTWRADTNSLREWVPPTAEYVASLESKLTESFADWDARQNQDAAKAVAK
ncbi:hypothetical protein [Streptomyces lunaelactis]|uniref:hypothetical protein n=1 Tax=Streptomyces lunaelactis TaxID=1535768 RepID=UPI00158494BD|nr:hypothetical protein [Streptomyces lunaelactis]NUL13260.1 hypothetical protein [Streptomyces lunaelactis]